MSETLALLGAAGFFRLAASRQPYRRAGIAIAARGVFTIVPREQLNGDQVITLLMDPVVDIAIAEVDADDWIVLAKAQREEAAKEIERLRPPVLPRSTEAELAVDPAELERLRKVDAAWHADQCHLHDQGFQTLEALTDAWAKDRIVLRDLEAELETSKADAGQLLVTIATHQETIAELQKSLAETPKPATAKPKAKPAEN